MRDWVFGNKDWVSMGQLSNNNPFGISENIMFSFPSECKNKDYSIVNDISLPDSLAEYIKTTEDELLSERDSVLDLL